MNTEMKNIYASIVSTVLMFATYAYVVSGMFAEGRFAGPEGLALLGKAILVLIVGGIVVHIIVMVLAHFVVAVFEQDSAPSQVVDERDKLIELRGLRVSYYVFGAGYVGSMVALAMGMSAFGVFNLLLAFCAIAGLVEALLRLALYHRGF